MPNSDDMMVNLKRFSALATRKAVLESELDEVKKDMKALEEVVINDMDNFGLERPVVDGRCIFKRVDIRAGARSGDGNKEALIEGLKAVAPALIKEGYNANSLAAWVREIVRDYRDQEGQETAPMEDILKTFPPEVRDVLAIHEIPTLSTRVAS